MRRGDEEHGGYEEESEETEKTKSLGLWCIRNITEGSAPYKKKSTNTTKLI
jgi:hypothetical protein